MKSSSPHLTVKSLGHVDLSNVLDLCGWLAEPSLYTQVSSRHYDRFPKIIVWFEAGISPYPVRHDVVQLLEICVPLRDGWKVAVHGGNTARYFEASIDYSVVLQ